MKFTIICFYLLLHSGCTQSRPTSAEKIKDYESKARTFQTLADLQRLSPPYSTNNFAEYYKYSQTGLRKDYLRKAKKYRKLAMEEKKKTSKISYRKASNSSAEDDYFTEGKSRNSHFGVPLGSGADGVLPKP